MQGIQQSYELPRGNRSMPSNELHLLVQKSRNVGLDSLDASTFPANTDDIKYHISVVTDEPQIECK